MPPSTRPSTLGTLSAAFSVRSDPPADPSFARLDGETHTHGCPAPSPPLVLVAFVFPAFAGFNFGFDIGSTSGAIQQLSIVDVSLAASPLLTGLLTSGSLFGTVIGVLLSFTAAAPLGRRGELLLASVLYIVGTLGAVSVPEHSASFLGYVFASRVIYGVGIAFAMHAAPVYIAEIAPPSIRGLLVSLKEGFIVLGILAGFSASAAAAAMHLTANRAFRLIWLPPLFIALVVFTGACRHHHPPSRHHHPQSRHHNPQAATVRPPVCFGSLARVRPSFQNCRLATWPSQGC